MRLKVLILSLGVVPISNEATAQTRTQTVPIVAGSRVRVKTPTLVAPLVANFLEQRGDTLVFIEDGRGRGVWSFGMDQIERLETTAGEATRNSRPMLRGAAIGAAAGVTLGVLFAMVAEPSDSTREYSQITTGALVGLVGAGVGAWVGSRVKEERWVVVPLTRQLSIRANRRGILALGFEFR